MTSARPRARERSSPPQFRQVGRQILRNEQWEGLGKSLQLSGRELQILQGVFDDQTEAAVARELGISPHTVPTHLERLYRKLGVASRAGAVVRVFGAYIHGTV